MKPIDLKRYKHQGGYDGWLYINTYMKGNNQGFNRFLNLKGGWFECFRLTEEPHKKEVTF